ncbi:MAG TPA: pyruvate synthase [Spirochaetota bacterium]|nr:pyruvate synthase [Spirochaetota bacterium]
MTRKLLTGNAAAAWGARLACADYIPAFPITPQTEIIETLADWIDSGAMNSRMTMLESEHSMVTAAGAAAASGVRVFTATSSQGLLYAMEMIYTVSGWRAPFVMVNVSRALATPLTLEPDHNDVLGARDTGFLQIHCSTCQEVLDTVLIAYRISEDSDVRLPVIVNLDGFYLSFTREPVEIPGQDAVKKFLPEPGLIDTGFHRGSEQSRACAVLTGDAYSYFRYQCHLAMINGLEVYNRAAEEFRNCFGRMHRAVETYMMDDAEYCFVMAGSFATKAMDAVDRLRNEGWRIGLVRPRLFRPFPENEIRRALRSVRAAAVIDQNISMGRGGILHTETAAALYGEKTQTPLLASYVAGLGGLDITPDDFYEMACELEEALSTGKTPQPRLIFKKDELEQVEKMQRIAGNIL